MFRPSPPAPGGRQPGSPVCVAVLWFVLLLGFSVAPASGQVSLGLHGVVAADAFGGAPGAGGRLILSLPLFPVDIMAAAETFLPDCDDADCSLRGVSVDASVELLPLPVVTPYVTGGFTVRRFDTGTGEGSREARGPNLGAGVQVGLAGLRIFGEGRYEFLSAPERQAVFRLGVLFGG